MEYIRAATRDYATGSRVALEVDCRSGNTVVEGQDVDHVTVQVVAHVWEDSPEAADGVLARILAGIRHQGGTLVIRTPELGGAGPWFLFGRGTRVDYAITVPHDSECRISSRSGRVEVARVGGPVEIEQRSGRTSVREIGADVAISTRSGSTDVEDVRGAVSVAAHSGKVSVRVVGGDVRASSHSGAVQVERVGGNVEARSQSGRVTATEVAGHARVEAASGSVNLNTGRGGAVRTASGSVTFRGAVQGDLTIQTASGSVSLEVDPERPFQIEAESTSGSISSSLQPRRDGTPPPEGAPRVVIRTASGSIRISRYSGF